MRFKEEFIKELVRRLKENIDIVESSFNLSGIELVRNKLYDIDPIEFRLPILVEDDPYDFVNKLSYSIINKNEIKVVTSNIACDLLLELVNLILKEFQLERIGRIGE
ncbi:MAG: hypothetical protein II625_08670 [Bacilli bacterium]|nr:hypothetical protein [Bacilli bacterium]